MQSYPITQSERVLKKAFINVAERLEMSRQELCAVIGINDETLYRLYEGKQLIDPRSKEGELARMLLRLYRNLDTLCGGNKTQSQLWFRSYNFQLSGIPADLIKSSSGLMSVVIYLDAMR